MKKLLSVLLTGILAAGMLASCSGGQPDNSTASTDPASPQSQTTGEPSPEPTGNGATVVVGATPVPHVEILEVVKPVYEAMGYTLKIMEFTDYIQPNLAVADGDIDANFFQHQAYLDDFNAQNNTEIVTILGVHYEPLGIYPGKTASFDALADGAQIAVPNDPTNEARALLLLEAQGLIQLNPDAGLAATKQDITDNPKNLDIIEIEAAQIARTLEDVDLAVINGNYALQAGLNAATDALAKEEKDSEAAQRYTNVLVVNKGNEEREELVALVEAINSDEVKAFIEEHYQGSVISMM